MVRALTILGRQIAMNGALNPMKADGEHGHGTGHDRVVGDTVLAQCSSFVCLRITNPEDQEYVRSLVPASARGILEALTSLAQGEAIAAGEAVPMPVRFRVTMPDPPPNAQSIEYGHMWSRGPTETDVESIVDSWRRQRR